MQRSYSIFKKGRRRFSEAHGIEGVTRSIGELPFEIEKLFSADIAKG